MKKWLKKFILTCFLCAVAIATVLIGKFYFQFISDRIYEDSTNHLREIYNQVNRTFGAFVERNWGLLESWEDYLSLSADADTIFSDFIEEEKEYWGFSQFYFIAQDHTYLSLSGETGSITLAGDWDLLMMERERVMSGETLPEESDVTVFAVPKRGTYQGYSFDAIAVSYTNEALAKSLDADAFPGKAKCFVIHSDGAVLLSTQDVGGVFANYLSYLKNASDLSEETLIKIQSDWESGKEGFLQCRIGKGDHEDSYSILYLPIGYQDYFLLSVVPQSAISAGFLSVQKSTMSVFISIFLLIGVTVIALLVLRSYNQTRKGKLELQYRERMFDVLSNSVDDIFIMLDPQTQLADYISPNIERLLGIPYAEVKADMNAMVKCAVDYNIVVPKEELSKIPLNGNKFWECEYMHQSTGERRWYRVTIYHMSIQDVKKYIIVMSDRTQEKQMTQKLQEALNAAKSANEAKSNFLSNMSHDIRTPMNAIVGFSVLLEKDAANPEKVREYTHKIMASSHHLLSLINDVLDMSKIESGKTSLNVDRFSLPELLEELNIILMPQAKAKRQEFLIQVQGAPPEQMLGDKLRLNQILLNLLSNAIKYTQTGGRIEFIVSEIPQTAPQFTKLRFVVRDNGIGMSKEFQEKVFLPFSREISSVTNKIQGTGLGMAITKNLVDLMGGIITVESEPGKGSTFTVEMSFSLPEKEESESWFRQKITRVLACDDEVDICLNIQEMMRDTGVDVSFVTDGASAVEKAVQAHLCKNDFHVILLDWKMPGMDGVETARRIREKIGSNVPILVLTSYDWSDIETEARQAGINAFMPKPFFASTFWQTIKPLFVEQSNESELETPLEDDVMKGRRFLIAEDNELNAEILTEMLKMEGALCELSTNGKEAVERFENSEPGYFDLILMDVQMPVMNGYEATKKIRASLHPCAKTIPIVAMTANTFAEDVRNAMDAGMDGHLAKPIDMNAVKETVGKLIKKSRPEESI